MDFQIFGFIINFKLCKQCQMNNTTVVLSANTDERLEINFFVIL